LKGDDVLQFLSEPTLVKPIQFRVLHHEKYIRFTYFLDAVILPMNVKFPRMSVSHLAKKNTPVDDKKLIGFGFENRHI